MRSLRFFVHSIVLYALTAAVTLVAVARHVAHPETTGIVGPLDLTLTNGLIFLSVFVVFTVVMVRFVRVAHLSLSFFLFITFILGAQFIFASWIPSPYDFIIALSVPAVLWLAPRVLVHDIAIMLGIGGIAGVLGLSLTPLIACVFLAVLSLYDIVSVYRTHHMVTLANRMLESGSVFGFLIPARLSGFMARRDDALRTRSVMMLGSGDIGLPLVLAASAVSQSLASAVSVVIFALFGVAAMHWLFSHQTRKAPMAALPPIAMSAILGYVLAITLGI